MMILLLTIVDNTELTLVVTNKVFLKNPRLLHVWSESAIIERNIESSSATWPFVCSRVNEGSSDHHLIFCTSSHAKNKLTGLSFVASPHHTIGTNCNKLECHLDLHF